MKKRILIPFVALMFLAAGSASAQDKGKESNDETSCLDGHFKGDYHCYRAWRKDMKIRRKEMQAEDMEHYRPWAAERKMRAAYRKAWKRDMLENDHRTGGYSHDWWGWGWHGRDYWY